MRKLIVVLLAAAMLMTMGVSALAEAATAEAATAEALTGCAAGNHSWDAGTVKKQPDCTREGATEYTCTVCGIKATDPISALGHNWGEWTVTAQPSCVKNGKQYHICTVCGKKETVDIETPGHQWTDWNILVQADNYIVGSREHTCQVCGEYKLEEYYPDGTVKYGDRGDAAKEVQQLLADQGYLTAGGVDGDFGRGSETALKKFQTANGLVVDGIAWPQVIDLMRHQFGDWTVVTEMTDFSKGLKQRVCAKCGFTEQEEMVPEGILQVADHGNSVLELQTALNNAGYSCGAPDGDYGIATINAVTALQNANGLTPDGIAWPGIRKMLLGEEGFAAALEREKQEAAMAEQLAAQEAEAAQQAAAAEQAAAAQPAQVAPVETPAPITQALQLEAVTDYSLRTLAVGESLPITVRATNTGDTILSVWGGAYYYNADPYKDQYSEDALDNGEGSAWNCLRPGESFEFNYTVIATEADVECNCGLVSRKMFRVAGSYYSNVTGQPILEGEMDDTWVADTTGFYSNELLIDIPLVDRSVTPVTVVTLKNQVTSTPANGAYYVEGETVAYHVVAENVSSAVLKNAALYASAKDNGGVVATVDTLDKGAIMEGDVEYVVTAKDVENGYVKNVAVAEFTSGDTRMIATSDEAAAKTAEAENEAAVGAIDLSTYRADGADYCSRTLIGRTIVETDYEADYCSTHATIRDAINLMVKTADTDAAKLKAYQYAIVLYQKDLNRMYDAMMASADSIAKAVILQERMQFFTMLEDYRATMLAMNPDAEAEAEQRVAEMVMDRCLDLCYTLHTAPNARLDSLMTATCDNSNVKTGVTCDCVETVGENGNVRIEEKLCSAHSVTMQMANLMLAYGADESSWNTVCDLWRDEAKTTYTSIEEGLEDQQKAIVRSGYKSFEKWMELEKAFLKLVYPDNPEIVAEQLSHQLQKRIAGLCAISGKE